MVNKNILISVFIMTLLVSNVMAINLSNQRTENDLACAIETMEFRKCYYNHGLECDFNNDGLWSLIDIAHFARNRCQEETNEPEPVNKPIKKNKSNKGILQTIPQPDGSMTYITNAHAFQLKQGVLLTWTKGFQGRIYWENKTITIQDGKGINIR